ncbi:MAG: ABC transporter substrate-binding protein [Actinomycetota bacterium]|nr:ABC transporter substrate-binding protein [Actinomycetota bacterium]
MPRSRLLRLAVALLAATAIAGCGLVGASQSQLETVVVGSADFTESQLLGEIYTQALQAKGVEAEHQPNIGAREAYMKAIEGDNPSINVMPEYLGYLLEYYDQSIPDTSVPAVTRQLSRRLPQELETLQVSQATDEDAIVVTQETARRYDLQTIGDLAPVADQLVAGGSPEFRTRRAGLAGMREVYGVEFKDFKTLDAGGPLSLEALLSNQIQVSDFFTTQSLIEDNNLVILDDPKNIVLPGNIVPVIRDDVPDRAQVERTLNDISAVLTTQALTRMVAAVDEDKQPIDAVAERFLEQQGLV